MTSSFRVKCVKRNKKTHEKFSCITLSLSLSLFLFPCTFLSQLSLFNQIISPKFWTSSIISKKMQLELCLCISHTQAHKHAHRQNFLLDFFSAVKRVRVETRRSDSSIKFRNSSAALFLRGRSKWHEINFKYFLLQAQNAWIDELTLSIVITNQLEFRDIEWKSEIIGNFFLLLIFVFTLTLSSPSRHFVKIVPLAKCKLSDLCNPLC